MAEQNSDYEKSAGPIAGAVTTKRPDSIKDALKMLDDALAGNSDELVDMVGEEFKNIKQALTSLTTDTRKSLRTATANVTSTLSDGLSDGYSYVDTQVRSNPWAVIGGIALGTFALGLVLGRRSESDPLDSESSSMRKSPLKAGFSSYDEKH